MQIFEYKIKKGDTLESIAKEYDITVDELKDFHNSHCGVASLIVTDRLPIQIDFVIINSKVAQKEVLKSAKAGKIEFDKNAIYRCKQLNITRIEEDIKSYSELKKEFAVKYSINEKLVSVNLNDFYYEFNPPALSRVFDFISKVDYIRNDCIIELDDLGRFSKIVNKDHQLDKWQHFKNVELNKIEFIKVIRESKPKEYNKLLKQGDLQFSKEYNDENDFNRDLFYLILLDKYLINDIDNLQPEEYTYKSQLCPDVTVPMNLRYDFIKRENDQVTVRKVWETKESDELVEEISKVYEKYHQPLIKYKFTKYKLDMRCLLTYNDKTKIISNAELSIIENIENNIKSECIFNIKNVERE